MGLLEILAGRLGKRDILELCAACSGTSGDALKAELFSLISHADDRVGYNALWVFTHFPPEDMRWLEPKRCELVATALHTVHMGKRRLALTLLDRLPAAWGDVDADYIDFCLSRINSTEPYGVRALCIKQAFAICRSYPELTVELKNELELMGYGDLPPGILSVRKRIMRSLSTL